MRFWRCLVPRDFGDVSCREIAVSVRFENVGEIHSVCFYLLFYALVTLVIRRWKPDWKPWAILLTVYGICNFLALFNIVHNDGWFSILTPMNILLRGNDRLIVPLIFSGAVLLIVLIQAFLPSERDSRE